MDEHVYKCASCEREVKALVNNRHERRCERCYAVLSDAMLILEPDVVAPEPAAPPSGLPVEQEQRPESLIKLEQWLAAESLAQTGRQPVEQEGKPDRLKP